MIAVVGITSELEGEEMPINEEGFAGGDRTSLDLPKPEEDLVEAVAATGKPLIVVLMNGSALSVNWAKDHANAILESWYAGEEGGAAIAETISGKNNPAGRLPVTFYTGVNQLPPFEDYAMKNRTYRYFDGTPLYPFGYGLSYTTFSFSDLKLSTSSLNAGDPLNVEATVTNKGKIPGDEVAELYLSFPKVPGAPNIALRGFQRVHLDPGASQKLQFTSRPARPKHRHRSRRTSRPRRRICPLGRRRPTPRHPCRRTSRNRRRHRPNLPHQRHDHATGIFAPP